MLLAVLISAVAALQLIPDPQFSNPSLWIALCATCPSGWAPELLTSASYGESRPLRSGDYMFYTAASVSPENYWLGTILWQSQSTSFNVTLQANQNTADVAWTLDAELYTGSMLVAQRQVELGALGSRYRNFSLQVAVPKPLEFPNVKFILSSKPINSWSTVDGPTGWFSIRYVSVEGE